MQVGNGCFAFGTDITGLQTFVPFATMSDWGWKNDQYYCEGSPIISHGEDSSGPSQPSRQWLISNPNRMNLGRIGLWFCDENVTEDHLEACRQELDLWTGTIRSTFIWKGEEANITTTVHPAIDAVGIKVESSLVAFSRLGLFFDFPFNDGMSKFSAPYVGSQSRSDTQTVEMEETSDSCVYFLSSQDDSSYEVGLRWHKHGSISHLSGHRYGLKPSGTASTFEILVLFCKERKEIPSCTETFEASQSYWSSFWNNGGIIDLSRSSDPRWNELERRIILSQYVMAINETGHDPPQESGLVNLGWYGKFHMEMYPWHCAYLALFNQWPLLERSLSVYNRFLSSAIALAASQGYQGARWPKMTDPSGRPAPGEINNLLIWQQPHPMLFAELDYRAHPIKKILYKWKNVIHATADFMVSYVSWNKASASYDLKPPMHIMSENTKATETINPSFELSYWGYGLSLAIRWWDRLGIEPQERWSHVCQHLSPKPVSEGVYIMHQGIEDMWNKYNWEHPALVGMFGWLPGHDLDATTMLATSERVWKSWRLDKCWGWDFGMLAMNAARVGHYEKAIEFLLDKNLVLDDVGLVQGTKQVPSPYFPGNGSFLYAIAFMAAGWDGAPSGNAPGFPSQGWDVQWENLSPAL